MNIILYDSTMKIVDFDPRDSNAVIEKFIERCEDREELISWRISFSGFNDDPRELIEIPAAREFAKRLIDRGILVTLLQPQPQGAYISQIDTPALDALGVHAIAVGLGEVKRKGKRVNITMDIDIVDYFTALLKTLKERCVDPHLIHSIEKIIEKQQAFDPLSGSSKFAADVAFDEKMQKKQPTWHTTGRAYWN